MVKAMGNRQWAMGCDSPRVAYEDGILESINSYRDLSAWQEARVLGLAVYRATSTFPAEERFGLISQLRRGAVSVPSNIAEGYGRGRAADYARFLRVARGALFELETQVLFALDLEYLSTGAHAKLQERIDATARPLSGLIRAIESRAKGQ